MLNIRYLSDSQYIIPTTPLNGQRLHQQRHIPRPARHRLLHAYMYLATRLHINTAPKRLFDKYCNYQKKTTFESEFIETMFYFILYLALQVVLFGAWVSGILDPYQKKLQELLLEAMGETKISYGLKSMYLNYWNHTTQ